MIPPYIDTGRYIAISIDICQYVLMQDCCPPLFEGDLDAADAEELAGALKAVADPARLMLLNMIASSGEACACDLTAPVGLTQPTVSHHLKVLTEAGFLEREQRG